MMMMMKANQSSSLIVSLCVVVVLVMSAGGMGVADAVCSLTELEVCLPAMLFGQSASRECCNKLNEQTPCFCEYMRNPSLRPYVDSPNATKIAAACGVAIPTCSIN